MIAPRMDDIPRGHSALRNWTRFWILAGFSSALAVGLTVALETYPIVKLAVRDVAAVARDGLPLPFFTGWISNVGIVGWFAAAAALLVSAHVCFRRGRQRLAAFTGGGGIISLLLGTDDLFMLHDGASPTGEETVLLLWLVVALTWAVSFRRELLHEVNLPLLVLAAVFLGHSVIADVATSGALLVHEDASKLVGILLWTTWAWATAERAIEASAAAVTDSAHTAVRVLGAPAE